MKSTLLCLLSLGCLNALFAQSNFYQVALPNVAGNQISLAGFTGKKIVVTVCSASNPDMSRLKMIDSLSRANPSITFVVIPVQDFDAIPVAGSAITQLNSAIKKSLVDSLQVNYLVGAATYGKKTAISQQPFLQWLTNKTSNAHFDYDLSYVWQSFVVSEKGRLFAVLEGKNDLLTYFSAIAADQVPDN